jgi:hypothetical protein
LKSIQNIFLAFDKQKDIGKEEMWMTQNPGSQGKAQDELLMTGSFHPINATQEDWESEAYIKPK